MNFFKHKFEECKAIAFVTYKEWSAYRTHSLISAFVGPVYFIVQYFIWTAVYGENSSLGGMELPQMIRYFGISTLISYLVMDSADWNLQMLVHTGKFLTFMLRPMHHRFFAFSQKVGHRVLGFMLEFLPCFLIFEFVFKIDMIPSHILLTVISVALAFLMNFYINYCLGLTAFWLVQSSGIRAVYQIISAVFAGGLVPLSLFPAVMQRVMMFLPFQYINYIPSMVWTGSNSIGAMGLTAEQAVLFQLIAVIAAAIFSEIIYRISIKRFTAVGA